MVLVCAAVARAEPGSYAHIRLSPWPAGATTVEFQLPMALKAHRYVGADQFAGRSRYAYTLGPILLAAVAVEPAAWNETIDCLHFPKLDPATPEDWLVPAAPLHFTVAGMPRGAVEFKPYFAVNANDTYATTPAFD